MCFFKYCICICIHVCTCTVTCTALQHCATCVYVHYYSPFFCPVHRQYEEKQLKGQQERAQRRLEFANQVSRLQNQLAYEKQRDTAGE